MRDETLTTGEVHTVLFDILCYFDAFCNEHNIKYFLSNGTLLGAAKYNDFIPWDDDVDVILPRNDYDRLMRLPEINNGKYRLLCREQVPQWKMPYAKLSCEATQLREGQYDFGVPLGLSMDIFPVDRWNPDLFLAKRQAFRCECLKRMLVFSIGNTFETRQKGIKRIILKCLWICGKACGPDKIRKKLDGCIKKNNKMKRKYSGCLAWTCHLDKEIFPAEYFEKSGLLQFGGKMFPVIKDYENYLSALYGNWRDDLPPEKQKSNHEIEVRWKNEQ